MKIVIITEGGHTLGMGHVYRTLALARLLRQQCDVVFCTKSDAYVVEMIESYGFEVISTQEDYREAFACVKPDTVVIDRLEVPVSLAKYIKGCIQAKLVLFGSIGQANKYADVVINAIIGTELKNKKYYDKHGTLYLEGPKYVVLRDEFYNLKEPYVYRNELKRILVVFGGSDPANLTCRIFEDLGAKANNYEWVVCLGPAFRCKNQLVSLIDSYKYPVDIIQNAKNVADLMMGVDMVLTSPGNTLFEAFCLRVPVVAFYQNALQQNMFNGFVGTYKYDEHGNMNEFIQIKYKEYKNAQRLIKEVEAGKGRSDILSSVLEERC